MCFVHGMWIRCVHGIIVVVSLGVHCFVCMFDLPVVVLTTVDCGVAFVHSVGCACCVCAVCQRAFSMHRTAWFLKMNLSML